MHLTPRDNAILSALTTKVRLLTLAQMVEAWWPASSSARPNARKRVALLLEAGLIKTATVPAHPMLSLDQPILTWRPGDAAPDFDQVAYQLQSRWPREYVPTHVYHASHRAARHYGSRSHGAIRHPDQATHDLHLSSVFLRVLRDYPQIALQWVGEDEFAPEREGEKLPDAVVKDAAGAVRLVIEFGGKYDPKRFKAFHEDCASRQLPYQLW